MILNNNFNRLMLILFFSGVYINLLVYKIYILPFELNGDLLNYYNHFTYDGIDVFGIEFLLPTIFFICKIFGFTFYDTVFLLGLFYFVPIISMLKYIKTNFFIFYFLFFIFYFVPNYAFLMRQYLAFFLIVLFVVSNSRYSFVFLLFSIFAHLSSLIFIFFIYLKIKKGIKFFLISIIVIFIFFLNTLGYGLLENLKYYIELLLLSNMGSDLERKLYGMYLEVSNINIQSISVYLLLIVTIIIHSIYIIKNGENELILKLFLFSAYIAIIFSWSVVVSNRFGFAAFFFAVPYFLMIISRLDLSFFKLKIIRRN